jgi:ParB-like chromosome segregation protein Spo0J
MLSIEYKSTGELVPYVNNSRTHSEQQVQQVAASIKEFGFTNPILIDHDGGIIAGHGRLQAAQLLSLDEVPTITLEGLTEAQRKAYVIADNQLALNAGWDLDSLKLEVDRLTELDFDLDLLGFDDSVLQDLINTMEPNFDPATEEEQGQLDELDPKWVDCPHCGKEFDMRGQV